MLQRIVTYQKVGGIKMHGDRAKFKSNKRSDYWANRPGSNCCGGCRCKYTKKRTHKIERLEGKKNLNKEE
jgi:hypothetical protein